MDFRQRYAHPDIGLQPCFQPHHRGVLVHLHPHIGRPAELLRHLLAEELVVLRPAQAALLRRRVGVERDAQFAVDLTAERRRYFQQRAVLQLQPIGHQHTHFVRQYLVELLQAGQDGEVQHHQIGRHRADEQQGDDQQQGSGKRATR